jgi:hypothetical protein
MGATKLEMMKIPEKKASFIEPMLLLPTPMLPEGPDWLYEVLCSGPHKISSVAFAVMWRWHAGAVVKTHRTGSDAT